MRKSWLLVLPLITIIGTSAEAFWGTGMYMTNPYCPWGMSAGGAAWDEGGEMEEYDSRIRKARKKLSKERKKSRKREDSLDGFKDSIRSAIETRLTGTNKDKSCDLIQDDNSAKMTPKDLATLVDKYNKTDGKKLWTDEEKRASIAEYSKSDTTTDEAKKTENATTEFYKKKFLELKEDNKKKSGDEKILFVKNWSEVSSYCEDPGFKEDICDPSENKFEPDKIAKTSAKTCKELVKKGILDEDKLQEDVDKWVEKKADRKDELIERWREDQEDDTEGGWCPECGANFPHYRAPRPSKWEVLGGVGAALGGAALGYLGFSQASKYNAKAGYATNPYGALGYAFPMMMGGVYGAIAGSAAQGGFGCAGGPFGGGFGMGPYGMMGPMGGMYGYGGLGMGMGWNPYMMNPYAMMTGGMFMPGMGLPGMGMGMPWGMGPGFGMGMGMPWGGMGMPGMGMGPGFGMGMGWPFMGAGMGWNPYGGMPGFGLGGGLGMGGMPWGGMPGMGLGGGFMPWGGMGGMPPWGMGGMGGMPWGGMPGMGGMGGMPGLGFDYQSQFFQQQQMQLELQMRMQQRFQSDQMARMRIASDLQSQLYQIQFQLQNVLSGTGSYGGGLGFGGGFGGGFTGGYYGGSYSPYARRPSYNYYRR